MIPKIIHQTAPENKNLWHPLWFACHESWKTHFSGFDHVMWTNSDNDLLIKNHYNQYYDIYQSFPVHIMKIDFVRFAILHKFGGIYADMDMFCYKNFYNDLNDFDCYVVESPYGNDPMENSLMVSAPNHDFWIQCMDICCKRFNEIKSEKSELLDETVSMSNDIHSAELFKPAMVLYITGTNLISSVCRKNAFNKIGTLPGHLFNNYELSYNSEYCTKHIHTCLWGEENINAKEKNKNLYQKLRKVSLEDFDFYKDYSQGHYLKHSVLDLLKNAQEHELSNNFNYY